MSRKTRVPPDARINILGKILPVLISAGFSGRTIHVNCVPGAQSTFWTSRSRLRASPGGVAPAASLRRTAHVYRKYDNIIVRLVQLGLRKVRDQTLVATMTFTIIIFLQPLRDISSVVSWSSASCISRL